MSTRDTHINTDVTEATATTAPVAVSEVPPTIDQYTDNDGHFSTIPHQGDVAPNAKSFGEKTFELATYRGLGFLGNAAFSLFLADSFEHGAGKKAYKAISESLAPKYAKAFNLSSQQSIEAAHAILKTSCLFVGGNLFLYPVKKLEEHKPKIVRWIDDKYNSSHQPTQMDLDIQERAHQRIDADAKPNWGTIMKSRMMSIIAVVGTTTALMGRDKRASDYLGKEASKMLSSSSSPTFNKLSGSTRFKSLLSDIGMETYQSFLAEEVLHLSTKHYKKMEKAKLLDASGNDNEAPLPDIVLTHYEQMAKHKQEAATKWQDMVAEEQPTKQNHADKVIEMAEAAKQLKGARYHD